MSLLQKINGVSSYDINNSKSKQTDNSFGHIFEETKNAGNVQNIQFSKHANMRLDTRNINLSNDQMNRLEAGIENARKKGIRDSLIMVDNVALVVNVSNRTVVTAINEEKKVFTNIDGAVIA